MNKFEKILIAGAGVAAGAVIVSDLLSEVFLKMAIDREPPKAMSLAIGKICGGTVRKGEVLERAEKLTEALKNREGIERVETRSRDGLRLVGHWYPCDGARRIVIAMHGWRSFWASDFGGIVDFWHDNGCSILLAEQRGQGESEGDTMGFGLTERYDCLSWAEWLRDNVGTGLPVYLAGISMGAATVLMSADLDLPETVHGIIADCGFTSPRAIWKYVAENNLHLPYALFDARVEKRCRKKLGCGTEECTTTGALRRCRVPVLLIHGTGDKFVPVSMSRENYEACASPKELFLVPGAGHGMSYWEDREGYEKTVLSFWEKWD